MRVVNLEPIEPGNPFLSDFSNMGITLGTNVTAMFQGFAKDFQKFIIIVDTTTGERISIRFGEDGEENRGVL